MAKAKTLKREEKITLKLNGEFDFDGLKVAHYDKDGFVDETMDLLESIKMFDGQEVSIAIVTATTEDLEDEEPLGLVD